MKLFWRDTLDCNRTFDRCRAKIERDNPDICPISVKFWHSYLPIRGFKEHLLEFAQNRSNSPGMMVLFVGRTGLPYSRPFLLHSLTISRTIPKQTFRFLRGSSAKSDTFINWGLSVCPKPRRNPVFCWNFIMRIGWVRSWINRNSRCVSKAV